MAERTLSWQRSRAETRTFQLAVIRAMSDNQFEQLEEDLSRQAQNNEPINYERFTVLLRGRRDQQGTQYRLRYKDLAARHVFLLP